MEPKNPQYNTVSEVQKLYEQMRPYLETTDASESYLEVRRWNPALMQDAQNHAEGLMLEHGNMDISDKYLYGFYASFIGMKFESGDTLPVVTEEEYQQRSDEQARILNLESEETVAYFKKIEGDFLARFPVTIHVLNELERDLKQRLGATPEQLGEGFYEGWYKAMLAVVPSFDGDK